MKARNLEVGSWENTGRIQGGYRKNTIDSSAMKARSLELEDGRIQGEYRGEYRKIQLKARSFCNGSSELGSWKLGEYRENTGGGGIQEEYD